MTTRQAVEGLCRGQRWAFLAISLGFLTRALIPAGFMPGASGLEFCSAGMRASLPAMEGHAHDHYHDGAGAPSEPASHGGGCVLPRSAAGLAPPIGAGSRRSTSECNSFVRSPRLRGDLELPNAPRAVAARSTRALLTNE
jgi:hypothetical protein